MFSTLDKIIDIIIAKKGVFLTTFFLVFLFSYAILVIIDFIPEPKEPKTENVTSKNSTSENTPSSIETKDNLTTRDNSLENTELEQRLITSAQEEAFLPEKIIFESLNQTVTVLNPTSRNIADLDNALLNGAVRHPDSATLNQDGTVFILGHSSYLPNVINENFQAFNGIQNLKWGDIIKVEAGLTTYIYKVNKVYEAKATATTIPIAGEDKKLVLATCNSFGSVDDRYIVEAKLIESQLKNS